MKSSGLICTILLAALVPAAAQQVSFKCSTNGDPKLFFTILTTPQQSTIGERIQLSSTSKGITYWKIFLRATDIEDGTVTYESKEGALASKPPNRKTDPWQGATSSQLER